MEHAAVSGIARAFRFVSDAARASECNSLWLRNGTQTDSGVCTRPDSFADGSRPSQGRGQTEQPAKQSGSIDKDRTRQTSQASDRDYSLSALRQQDHPISLCPSCGASLHEVGVKPGVVLDCFAGAGTTGLVADRLQRSAILIELNEQYAAMAERRIRDDAGMFAEVSP